MPSGARSVDGAVWHRVRRRHGATAGCAGGAPCGPDRQEPAGTPGACRGGAFAEHPDHRLACQAGAVRTRGDAGVLGGRPGRPTRRGAAGRLGAGRGRQVPPGGRRPRGGRAQGGAALPGHRPPRRPRPLSAGPRPLSTGQRLALACRLGGWRGWRGDRWGGTMASAMPVEPILEGGRPFTVADLEHTPDDGRRYELIDGVLIVSAAPGRLHQQAVLELAVVLRAACPPELQVFVAPFGIVFGDDTELQPDVLVARRADLTDKNLPAPPVLAVEVLSPSTRIIDSHVKRERFEREGTPAFWLPDPVTVRPADLVR